MIKKIIVHSNSLIERGGSIACYDYAYYAKRLLNLDPIVFYDLKHQSRSDTIEKFKKEFDTIGYTDFQEVQDYVDSHNVDYFYALKYGIKDNIEVKNARNLIHSVFNRNSNEFHGDVYAFISEWQSIITKRKYPFVPHMLNLPEHDRNLRSNLGIPKDALVIGRYGGKETFNIPFVVDTIIESLNQRNNLYFLFVNTPSFVNHPRCLFLDTVTDLDYKVSVINTCDAMLHARDYGETFGISILEFAAKNKQIISYDNLELQNTHPLGGRAHFMFLGRNCHKYTNASQLLTTLLELERTNPFDTTYLNELYSPERVMNQFQQVFLS